MIDPLLQVKHIKINYERIYSREEAMLKIIKKRTIKILNNTINKANETTYNNKMEDKIVGE